MKIHKDFHDDSISIFTHTQSFCIYISNPTLLQLVIKSFYCEMLTVNHCLGLCQKLSGALGKEMT